MLNQLANINLNNYSVNEIKQEKQEILQDLNTLYTEKQKLKKQYTLYKIWNICISLFYLYNLTAVAILPLFIFGSNSIFSYLFGTIALFFCVYIFQNTSNLIKGEDIIEQYKEIKQYIEKYEEDFNILEKHLKSRVN